MAQRKNNIELTKVGLGKQCLHSTAGILAYNKRKENLLGTRKLEEPKLEKKYMFPK